MWNAARVHILLLVSSCLYLNITTNDFKTTEQCRFTEAKTKMDIDCHGVILDTTKLCTLCSTPKPVRTLDLSETHLHNIPESCFETCKDLGDLYLASNNLTSLEGQVFKGLSNLISLSLDNNFLLREYNAVDLRVFKNLKSLKSLSIRDNGNGFVVAEHNICGFCRVMPDLQVLDLSYNVINTVSTACFKNCKKLKELSLKSCKINGFATNAFEGLSKLKTLNLDNNMLIKNGNISNPEALEPLSNLEVLHLQKNIKAPAYSSPITYLLNLDKDILPNLQRIYLDGLPNATFNPRVNAFKSLFSVDFSGERSYCYIGSLTNSSFQNLPNVTHLQLSFCNISSIEPGTFEPLTKLKYLNLSHNMALGFASLRDVSFGLQFTKIEILDYSKVYKTFGITTQLNRCDVWFLQYVNTLKVLYFKSNRLSSIETNALVLLPFSLELVSLEDNKLSFGPFWLQIGCISNLEQLELNRQNAAHSMVRYNEELHIHEKTRNTSGGCHVQNNSTRPNCPYFDNKPLNLREFSVPETLKSINYRSSSLIYQPSNLPAPLKIRNKVESLDISNNIIYIWKDPLILMDSLKQLNLSHNFCSLVSGRFFANGPNIERFDASFNKIGPSLEKDTNGSIFRRLRHLKVLNVSSNWIVKLPKAVFGNLVSLELLNLSFNQLENLEFDFDHMKNLSQLYLNQNKLSTLPLNLLEQLDNYSKTHPENATIDLTNNQIDATCDNIEFLSWLVGHSHYFVNIKYYTFVRNGSERISYVKFYNTFNDFKRSCRTYTIVIVLSSLFIIIFIAIIIGGMIYKYRWTLRYFYYTAKAFYRGYIPIRDLGTNMVYQYDVFISYANENYQFATGEMFERLSDAGLRLCLHHKDFLPGNYIGENIINAIRNSRMTLILLSPAFLESQWCIYEFNMAREESIYARGGEILLYVVMYEEVDLTCLSPEMRQCVESESYLAFPSDETERPYFWQMLIQALRDTVGVHNVNRPRL